MRNVFLFIKRYFNFLSFLGLQVFCLLTLFSYNSFHHAVFSNASNELTGQINTRYDKLQGYFLLRKTNEDLVKENARLRNMLGENFESVDSSRKLLPDSVLIKEDSVKALDTAGKARKYEILEARVVGNSVSEQKNYIQIHRGRLQGVKQYAGVIGPNGIVGKVVEVSDNFSVVMSVLNRDNSVSAKLKKSGETGYITWDGRDPQVIVLKDIPKSAQMNKGDSIITSGFTPQYPKGILIGTVMKVEQDKSSSTFLVSVKPATNFYNIQYVYVLNNLQLDELRQLEEKMKKKQ